MAISVLISMVDFSRDVISEKEVSAANANPVAAMKHKNCK